MLTEVYLSKNFRKNCNITIIFHNLNFLHRF